MQARMEDRRPLTRMLLARALVKPPA